MSARRCAHSFSNASAFSLAGSSCRVSRSRAVALLFIGAVMYPSAINCCDVSSNTMTLALRVLSPSIRKRSSLIGSAGRPAADAWPSSSSALSRLSCANLLRTLFKICAATSFNPCKATMLLGSVARTR